MTTHGHKRTVMNFLFNSSVLDFIQQTESWHRLVRIEYRMLTRYPVTGDAIVVHRGAVPMTKPTT